MDINGNVDTLDASNFKESVYIVDVSLRFAK